MTIQILFLYLTFDAIGLSILKRFC